MRTTLPSASKTRATRSPPGLIDGFLGDIDAGGAQSGYGGVAVVGVDPQHEALPLAGDESGWILSKVQR
jgi:hypothetical protein